MKRYARAVAAVLGSVAITSSALASPASEALGNCLIDNTTGKERKLVATWTLVALASHPELVGYLRTR